MSYDAAIVDLRFVRERERIWLANSTTENVAENVAVILKEPTEEQPATSSDRKPARRKQSNRPPRTAMRRYRPAATRPTGSGEIALCSSIRRQRRRSCKTTEAVEEEAATRRSPTWTVWSLQISRL